MCLLTARLARALGVVGLINVHFAIKDDVVHVLEANPRASRTVPWLSKAVGLPLARLATRLILGEPLAALLPGDLLEPREDEGAPHGPRRLPGDRLPPGRIFVKMPTFSSSRFPESDTLLGPEMRSTGEVLGIAGDFGAAFAKASAAAGVRLPLSGCAFLTVNDSDKVELLPLARDLLTLGFDLAATRGTAAFLQAHGLPVEMVHKVNEGPENAADRIAEGRIQLVINTPLGRDSFYDEGAIRRSALTRGIPCITTLSGSRAVVDAIRTLRSGRWEVESLQELAAGFAPPTSSPEAEMRDDGRGAVIPDGGSAPGSVPGFR
jgi:carbamoyl-phosphate synthase large subunit